MLLTHALALSADQFKARKSPYEYVHSVRIELTKLISVGTRITYQATRDARCRRASAVTTRRRRGENRHATGKAKGYVVDAAVADTPQRRKADV